ncbi:MAG: hypothetical protein R3E14_11485 [Erythrobacter sp.]
MKLHDAGRRAWLPLALQIVILIPAGLLVFYHATMLFDLYNGRGLSVEGNYNAIQGGLRFLIAASLIAVVLGVRVALWTMWFSIASLVATQYWAHFGGVQADFTAGRHPLSYLKGFIFPSIITAAFLLRARIEA